MNRDHWGYVQVFSGLAAAATLFAVHYPEVWSTVIYSGIQALYWMNRERSA